MLNYTVKNFWSVWIFKYYFRRKNSQQFSWKKIRNFKLFVSTIKKICVVNTSDCFFKNQKFKKIGKQVILFFLSKMGINMFKKIPKILNIKSVTKYTKYCQKQKKTPFKSQIEEKKKW